MVATVFLALGLIALIGSLVHWWLPDLDVALTRRVAGELVINVFRQLFQDVGADVKKQN